MTLELADRSVSKPLGIAKDVSFKVGVFHFPADFVVVDFEPDPRGPLILGRCFLKTSRALIDVHKGELTLRIGNEAITYNLDQTVRYSANYNQMTGNKIDVVELACKEYSQEVLGFSNVTDNGIPTPQNEPIVFVTSPTLTPFGDSDFFLFEEADTFLGLEDDPDSLKINPFYYNPEGDILLLEAILNSEPSPPLPNQDQNLPSFKEELKAYEAQTVKSSVDEPPEVELKDLPHHLEMPPKRTSTSEAPTITLVAIRKLVANSVTAALEAQTANMANADNTNRNPEPREAPVARKCSYKEFVSCQPFNVKGSKGVVGLIRLFERTKSVFSRSNYIEDCKVEFKKLLIKKYCPRTEIQKMEDEFYHLTVKGNDLKTYMRRFQELATLCPTMVSNSKNMLEAFIGGLPRSIEGNVTISKPQTLEEAINIA
nr:reverse transcriptase domain-containing protein [Tanacetum cinerariifolium]